MRTCGVLSNRSKQEVYGGAGADLACVPATLRGGCFTPPNLAKGYAGGRLQCCPPRSGGLRLASVCRRSLGGARACVHMWC